MGSSLCYFVAQRFFLCFQRGYSAPSRRRLFIINSLAFLPCFDFHMPVGQTLRRVPTWLTWFGKTEHVYKACGSSGFPVFFFSTHGHGYHRQADLIFARHKPKGSRKISFDLFLQATVLWAFCFDSFDSLPFFLFSGFFFSFLDWFLI